jgi:REP element-mobilizing transposase RayT
MAYWQLYYHLVWATKNREPLITPELEPELFKYLRGKGLELGGVVHAVGGMEEHGHVVVSIPPRIAIGDYVGKLKGASSHWVTHLSGYKEPFAWQEGYGVLSFSKRSLPQVVQYVLLQREHHRSGATIADMERIEIENVGP